MKSRSILTHYQIKKPMMLLWIMIILLLGATSALADWVLEPMGPFELSTGINGYTQSGEDHVYSEAYISCSCGAEKHNIQTQYRIEAAEGCPFDITLEITGRRENETGSGITDVFEIVCTRNSLPMNGGRYPFTLKVYAQCGEYFGWAEQTLDLDIELIPNQDGCYEYGNNSYKIYEGKYTWDEANALCEEMGGHLATITSAEEQLFIDYLNSNNACLWIGGYKHNNDNWSWVTGEAISYTDWYKNEPNNGYDEVIGRFTSANEDRMCLYPTKWNDANQDNKMGFICEWGTDVIPEPTPDDSENGVIFPDDTVLDTLPSITVPTIILPDGETIPTDITVKFNGQNSDKKQSIKYDVRLVDGEGNDVELPGECLLLFPYPDGLDMNSGRKYRIAIHHYGKEGTEVFSTEDGTIQLLPQGLCIRISSLSPFVIEWEEIAEVEMPQTGDNSQIALWLALLTLAGATLLTLKRKTA